MADEGQGGPDTISLTGDPLPDGEVVQGFWLQLLASDGQIVESYPGRGRRLVIGSHQSADVQLREPTVSRFHCEIAVDSRVAIVTDLGSRNGIRVDDVPVYRAPLRDGSLLRLGKARLRFSVAGESRIELAPRQSFGMLLGRSAAMREVFAVLERAAATDLPLLIEGETGTGKDVTAHSVHQESKRAGGPLVVVDCGSLAPSLIESELFGHMRGAFTGATTDRTGAFEQAHGGTVFLDEIGELALDLQPKLLRVLESHEVRPVGGDAATPVDVRIIAATNRNLFSLVNEGRFRADLYYRLAAVTVRLPPLRERPEDLPLLLGDILGGLDANAEAAERLQGGASLTRLAGYPWPGNIRELRNYVERALVAGDLVPPGPPAPAGPSQPPEIDPNQPLRAARKRWVAYFERCYLERLLEKTDDNVTAAARACGVDRVYLHRLLKRSGLR